MKPQVTDRPEIKSQHQHHMKHLLTLALAAVVVAGAHAEEKKDSVNKNKPVFTVVKENKITSIKDQSRSGTCWAYSTLSFFESEILRNTGKTYDLCENFVASKTYMDRAIAAVRMHGDISFSQGGSSYDPLYCANEGKMLCVVPQEAAQTALEAMKTHPLGADAAIIGRVTEGRRVTLNTRTGGARVLRKLSGAQLPRIC